MHTPELSNILLCDDHHISLVGIESILRKKLSGINVKTAPSGEAALEIFKHETPDLFVVDLGLPKMQGLDVIKAVRSSSEKCMIFVMTASTDTHLLQQVLKLGVNGLLQKNNSAKNLEEALEFVKSSPEAVYMDSAMKMLFAESENSTLTKREYEVLNFIVEGLTSPEIAAKMDCSVTTIKTYRVRIMNKSGARNTAEMIAWFLKGNSKRNFSSYS